MKKIFVMISAALSLTACSDNVTPQRLPNSMPPELKDCHAYYINSGLSGFSGYVFRCPDSSTTAVYHEGKTTRSTTTIDGDVPEPTPRDKALEKLTEEDKKALGL